MTVSDADRYEDMVRQFCQAWADGDFDKVVSWFTDDAVYHNIPVDPMVGHEQIRAMIDGFTSGLEVVEFKILEMLSRGSTVVTERVDIFRKPDGTTVDLPVMGIFEFEGDKIASWREYFDLNTFMTQAAPADT